MDKQLNSNEVIKLISRYPCGTLKDRIADVVAGACYESWLNGELVTGRESERYFHEPIEKVEELAEQRGMVEQAMVLRLTGCPNGCAWRVVAEVAPVGKGPGRYNLLLRGDGSGLRLARTIRKNLNESEVLDTLDALFGRYAADRLADERFGDFVIRTGLVRPVLDTSENCHECA